MRSRTWLALVTPVANSSAARPATCGVAIDVPAFQAYPVFEVWPGARIRLKAWPSALPSPPGAETAICAPKLE